MEVTIYLQKLLARLLFFFNSIILSIYLSQGFRRFEQEVQDFKVKWYLKDDFGFDRFSSSLDSYYIVLFI